MIRNIVLALLAIIVAVIGVVIVRTVTFGGTNANSYVTLPEVPDFNSDTVASHLTDVLKIKTITLVAGDPRPGLEGPWKELEAYLEATYPDLHTVATKTHIADLTLLYEWKGSDPSLDPILMMAHQDVCLEIGNAGLCAAAGYFFVMAEHNVNGAL